MGNQKVPIRPDNEVLLSSPDGRRAGSPFFSGFDHLIVTQTTQIFEEGFSNGLDTDERWNLTEANNGTVTVADSQGVFETEASGDSAIIETKLPHQFFHGFSTTWRIRVHTPDTGDAGAVREWGNFDVDNGYFFRLDGTGLHAVVRRKTIDVVTDIPGYVAGAAGYAIQYLNGNRVIFYFGPDIVHEVASNTTNLVVTPNLKSRISNIQTSTVGSKLISIFGLAVIRDGAPFRFNSTGALSVTSGAVITPPGATKVLQPTTGEFIEIDSDETILDFFLIPNGTTLTVQALRARVNSAPNDKTVSIALYFDPDGDTPGSPEDDPPSSWEIIDVLMGNNFRITELQDGVFTGDGTARIVLRTEQIGGFVMLVFNEWQGFTV